jgi:hypothetical protein
MYKRKVFLLGIIMVTLISSLSIPTILETAFAQTDNFLTYENPTYGFRLQYPSDWQRTDFNTSEL